MPPYGTVKTMQFFVDGNNRGSFPVTETDYDQPSNATVTGFLATICGGNRCSGYRSVCSVVTKGAVDSIL
ncbi:hypothetical protein KSP39_PZI023723 [Platanthera zijinensis]|uniref:Uncharacterized protein n=1 Tax=Platanthera zijinensis TaxID=2320716 RepID=A0AAP0FU08_9ASPA